jgi:hypothetical protein
MASKRLTFRDQDGKRHWVRKQRYLLPEGVVFRPADTESVPHNHTESYREMAEPKASAAAMEPAQLLAAGRSRGK